MNGTDVAGIEAALCRSYAEQLGHYLEAAGKAEELLAVLRGGADTAALSAELAGLLDKVAAAESRAADAKQAWSRLGRRAGPELQAVWDRLVPVLQRLIDCVRAAEEEALACQDRLRPEMGLLAQGRRMQQGYGQAARPAT